MARNTSMTLGEYFFDFVISKIKEGHFESTSEAVRAGLSLLEADETRLEVLRATLAVGEAELDRGDATSGDAFMEEMIS